MSQAILQELARLKAANEALAARVSALEAKPDPTPPKLTLKPAPGSPERAAKDG